MRHYSRIAAKKKAAPKEQRESGPLEQRVLRVFRQAARLGEQVPGH